MRTYNFQLRLFDTAVTLKFNQGHRKWYERVKPNKNNIFIFIVSEKIATLRFLPHTDTRLAGLTLISTRTHCSYESKRSTNCALVRVCVCVGVCVYVCCCCCYYCCCREILRTQKLKTRLLRSESSMVVPFKPEAGRNISMHATPTARDFFFGTF